MKSIKVNVDRQGRIVIPLSERERLGVAEGGTLELIPTLEGVLLEPRRAASVRTGPDGLPLITLKDGERIPHEASLEAIHRERERR